MKRKLAIMLCMLMSVGVTACGSSSSSSTQPTPSANEENNAEADAEEAEAEEPEGESVSSGDSTAWEVGEGKVVTWTDSIGSGWVQIIVPVTNTGTDNLYLSTGTMDLEDETGHLVDSRSMVSVYPDVIQPGETAFYYEETTLEIEENTTLKVVPHVEVSKAKVDCIRYDVSDLTLKDEEYGGIALTGRVENTTEEEGSMVYVTALLYGSGNEPLAQAFTILDKNLAAGDKIGFSASTFSVPDSVTMDAVDHYEVFAYPTQFQF